jgi:hypothetical protein
MSLPQRPESWSIERLSKERADAVSAFGFTDRQSRFLVDVLTHSGVFIERQYCAFAGITHGQKTTDFLRRLVERGYARPVQVGALHRGRLFHVCHKPLYAAIGEKDNRHRKPMALGRMVERLMLLDAVIADRAFTWLGTESDKRNYFMRLLQGRVDIREFPRLTFVGTTGKTHRYFPDKLPIGIEQSRSDYVFVYLITSPVPMDFRLFLLRHAEVLRALRRWTIRVLVPSPFARAVTLFGHAAREQLATPLPPSAVEDLEWFFAERRRRQDQLSQSVSERFRNAAMMFRAPQFQALNRAWQQDGNPVLWSARSVVLRDALQRGDGRVEFVPLTRQYCHLSSLVGVA